MTEPLNVETDVLSAASKILRTAAGQIPVPPPKVSVPGTDPLSLAIAQGAAQVEAPLAALPRIKAEATTVAENIGIAGQRYAETDQMLAEKAKQTIGSLSLSRIVTTQRQTLIAQLTVTALLDSPVDWDSIWFYLKPGAGSGSTRTANHAELAPVTGPVAGSR